MSIEDIIAKENDSPLFDKQIFLEFITDTTYSHAIEFIKILKKSQEKNKYKKIIYAYEIFITYKNKEYGTIMSQIAKEYSQEDVEERFDAEFPEWVDHEQMEDLGIEEDYEYYNEFNNREAEDVVYLEILKQWETKYNNKKELNIDDHCNILDKLEEKYQL